MDQIIKHNGHFTKIINNKDKLFVSSYWKTFMEFFFIKLKHFTTFYLQIDEQIK